MTFVIEPSAARFRVRKASGYELSPRSGMVSLDIPPGTLPSVPGGVDDHHITVVYLGKEVDDDLLRQVLATVRQIAATTPPLTGTLSGRGTFDPSDASEGRIPVFVKPDIPGIQALRPPLQQFNASQFADFKPHATLAYVDKGDPLPDPVEPTFVTFDRITVHRGQDVYHFPFTGKRYATGGIITEPTFTIVGENGPEPIIPLRMLEALGIRKPWGRDLLGAEGPHEAWPSEVGQGRTIVHPGNNGEVTKRVVGTKAHFQHQGQNIGSIDPDRAHAGKYLAASSHGGARNFTEHSEALAWLKERNRMLHRAEAELEVRDWAKWNEEHRPYGLGHYTKRGMHDEASAWTQGHHEVMREHQFAKGNPKQAQRLTHTEHRKEARKAAIKSLTKKGTKQAYLEGRAHAHHDLANETHLEHQFAKHVLGAGLLRVEPGPTDTRNWKKWHEEHPYLKKGRPHSFHETQHHAHHPGQFSIEPGGHKAELPVPPPPKISGAEQQALHDKFAEEAKGVHSYKAGSTRATRFESGYVAARMDAHNAKMSTEDAHALSERHQGVAEKLQANQAQAKRFGAAAGYHAHSIGHGEIEAGGGGKSYDKNSHMDFARAKSLPVGTKVQGVYQGHEIKGTVTEIRDHQINSQKVAVRVKLDHALEGDDIVARKPGDIVAVENDERGHYLEKAPEGAVPAPPVVEPGRTPTKPEAEPHEKIIGIHAFDPALHEKVTAKDVRPGDLIAEYGDEKVFPSGAKIAPGFKPGARTQAEYKTEYQKARYGGKQTFHRVTSVEPGRNGSIIHIEGAESGQIGGGNATKFVRLKGASKPDHEGAGYEAAKGGQMRVVPHSVLVDHGTEAAKQWYAGYDKRRLEEANIAAGIGTGGAPKPEHEYPPVPKPPVGQKTFVFQKDGKQYTRTSANEYTHVSFGSGGGRIGTNGIRWHQSEEAARRRGGTHYPITSVVTREPPVRPEPQPRPPTPGPINPVGPRAGESREAAIGRFQAEAKGAHSYAPGSTRGTRFEAGYVQARTDAFDKKMSAEQADEARAPHAAAVSRLQANQARAKREGLAAGYAAHAEGADKGKPPIIEPGPSPAPQPKPPIVEPGGTKAGETPADRSKYLKGSPKYNAFNEGHAEVMGAHSASPVSFAEAGRLSGHETNSADTSVEGAKHLGRAQAYNDIMRQHIENGTATEGGAPPSPKPEPAPEPPPKPEPPKPPAPAPAPKPKPAPAPAPVEPAAPADKRPRLENPSISREGVVTEKGKKGVVYGHIEKGYGYNTAYYEAADGQIVSLGGSRRQKDAGAKIAAYHNGILDGTVSPPAPARDIGTPQPGGFMHGDAVMHNGELHRVVGTPIAKEVDVPGKGLQMQAEVNLTHYKTATPLDHPITVTVPTPAKAPESPFNLNTSQDKAYDQGFAHGNYEAGAKKLNQQGAERMAREAEREARVAGRNGTPETVAFHQGRQKAFEAQVEALRPRNLYDIQEGEVVGHTPNGSEVTVTKKGIDDSTITLHSEQYGTTTTYHSYAMAADKLPAEHAAEARRLAAGEKPVPSEVKSEHTETYTNAFNSGYKQAADSLRRGAQSLQTMSKEADDREQRGRQSGGRGDDRYFAESLGHANGYRAAIAEYRRPPTSTGESDMVPDRFSTPSMRESYLQGKREGYERGKTMGDAGQNNEAIEAKAREHYDNVRSGQGDTARELGRGHGYDAAAVEATQAAKTAIPIRGYQRDQKYREGYDKAMADLKGMSDEQIRTSLASGETHFHDKPENAGESLYEMNTADRNAKALRAGALGAHIDKLNQGDAHAPYAAPQAPLSAEQVANARAEVMKMAMERESFRSHHINTALADAMEYDRKGYQTPGDATQKETRGINMNAVHYEWGARLGEALGGAKTVEDFRKAAPKTDEPIKQYGSQPPRAPTPEMVAARERETERLATALKGNIERAGRVHDAQLVQAHLNNVADAIAHGRQMPSAPKLSTSYKTAGVGYNHLSPEHIEAVQSALNDFVPESNDEGIPMFRYLSVNDFARHRAIMGAGQKVAQRIDARPDVAAARQKWLDAKEAQIPSWWNLPKERQDAMSQTERDEHGRQYQKSLAEKQEAEKAYRDALDRATQEEVMKDREFGGTAAAEHEMKGRDEGIKTARAALQHYPADWIRNSDRVSRQGTTLTIAGKPRSRTALGQYSHSSATVEASAKEHDVMTHELGHRMEYTTPGINEMEAAHIATRQHNDGYAALGSYGSGTTGVEDEFVDPYSGRVYEVSNLERAHEVLTTGTEALLGGNHADRYGALVGLGGKKADPLHRAFILGMLTQHARMDRKEQVAELKAQVEASGGKIVNVNGDLGVQGIPTPA